MILDTAGAKGTGKWMSQLALDLGVPSTLVTEAVYARCLSALKEARVRASKVLSGPTAKYAGDRTEFIAAVRDALYASKICSYAQGFVQLEAAAKEHEWPLDYGSIALLWRGGCIIRAAFLDRIKEAFDADPPVGKPAAGALTSIAPSPRPTSAGGWSPARPSSTASRCRRLPRRSPTSTVIASRGCRPTCCRRSATISAPIPTSASTRKDVSYRLAARNAARSRPAEEKSEEQIDI